MLTKFQHEVIELILLRETEGKKVANARLEQVLQLEPGQIARWLGTKEFTAELERQRRAWEDSSPAMRRTHMWAVLEAIDNYDRVRAEAEKRHWWTKIWELTKPPDTGTPTDYSSYTEDELWALIVERGLTDSVDAKLREKFKGEPCKKS